MLQQAERLLFGIDVTTETGRYFTAFTLFAICFLGVARRVQTPFGKRLVVLRENEERARMLGYDVGRYKLQALIGVLFMFYLIDASSAYTNANMLIAGFVLIVLTVFAPKGLAGTLRSKVMPWLP